jgi:hypothetical protein
MSDFIEFVSENATNQQMGSALKSELSKAKASNVSLQAWFKKQGYDLTLKECQELLEKKDSLVKHIDATNLVRGY